ncbi:hypothetical protein [Salipaludibacillus neizhouensis]|uniref:hypothetical protein n=1 Tax=Salipaludibacillus neizhouensis TaxID=885475 RepID=UPI00167DB556|nr:hypothetical protein [Salipaludibacillus neizhouensis]
MSELIRERSEKLSLGQNELRIKWIPEKYTANLEKRDPKKKYLTPTTVTCYSHGGQVPKILLLLNHNLFPKYSFSYNSVSMRQGK